MIPDEVDHRNSGLSLTCTKTASELLEKHDARLRRSEHDDAIDRRYVNALVEHVDGTDRIKLASFERRERHVAVVRAFGGIDRSDPHAAGAEPHANEIGVCDAAAKDQRTAPGTGEPRAPHRFHASF